MIVKFFIVLGLPAVISLLVTPPVIRFARNVGAIDQPNERKVHTTPMPRLGGLAIYISFLLSIGIILWLEPTIHLTSSFAPERWLMLVVSLVIVLCLGIWDDIRSISVRNKIFVQLVAATIVYLGGYRLSFITDPLGNGILDLGIFDYPATVLWIIGITNAFNLIDGLDGLASGVAVISALTIFGVSYIKYDVSTAIISLVFAGAVIGFLRYNFNPARIFLGDSGSLFLGFTIAVLSMQSSTKGTTAFAILIPVITLGLPIMETLLSMVRRLLRGLLPSEKHVESFLKKLDAVFLPDNRHIHHRLIQRGLSHRSAVLFLYLISCGFGIGAFLVTVTNNIGASLILIAVGVATVVGVRQLKYREMAILKNGLLLPLYRWPLLNTRIFQGFLDLAFVVLAFGLSYYLAFRGEMTPALRSQFVFALPFACGSQIFAFLVSGLYKISYKHLGIGDVLKIIKSVGLAIIFTSVILALIPTVHTLNITLVVLNFFILLSFMLAMPISYHILNYLFHAENGGTRQVIIYGADSNGILTLQKILHDKSLNLSPLGFLDDSPHMEGKRMNGYPVFGGHWKLERLARLHHIDQILISTDHVKPKALDRLHDSAKRLGIAIKRSVLLIEDMTSSPNPLTQQSLPNIRQESRIHFPAK
jgi:UDP-GlcNAc:undecaprenyl-phosphate GlcNAc-1-phosphate transferase